MKTLNYTTILWLLINALLSSVSAQPTAPFASSPLQEQGDFSTLMLAGIDRYLVSETERVRGARESLWTRDFSTPGNFSQSIAAQRDLLARRLGVVETRVPPELEVLSNQRLQLQKIATESCQIYAVRWQVIEGLAAEGLLLRPKDQVKARVVLIPDADIMPEVYAGMREPDSPGYGVARKLAEAGWEVLVPLLVNRKATYSGSELVGRFTNQPHREWIYRQGYEVGRHVIGYEVQKVLSAIDWFEARSLSEGKEVAIGVAGYGEGGLLALQTTALDPRVQSTLISGYFDAREQVWQEPIYRNVFGAQKYFADAELAVMAWPRQVVIEHSVGPEIDGPPAATAERSGAAPGVLKTPSFTSAKGEWDRAQALLPVNQAHLRWFDHKGISYKEPYSPDAMASFAQGLKVELPSQFSKRLPLLEVADWLDLAQRQERAVRAMEHHVQRVMALSEHTRMRHFWQTLKGTAGEQEATKALHRQRFWEQLGRLPGPSVPANPRSRLLEDNEKWTSYEITLDVWPEVFAWGILLVPKDIKPGEKRAAVVCQHGLEGLPIDVITTDTTTRAFRSYKGFAVQLAERGFVTFAPHNPYRGEDHFRVLQRKANPLGLSLFSFIIGQHQRIVEWLGQQSFIDRSRIGFYGLSYGGKTAMRVPPLVEGYALSICSGDFNDWVRKNASTDHGFSYMFHGEYEMPEWDLGHTFNYAEMAALIAPRPFMVERGHHDGVGIDEWVAYEFAKVRRHYSALDLPQAVAIEYFNGPHTINGVGTFKFLDRFLKK